MSRISVRVHGTENSELALFLCKGLERGIARHVDSVLSLVNRNYTLLRDTIIEIFSHALYVTENI